MKQHETAEGEKRLGADNFEPFGMTEIPPMPKVAPPKNSQEAKQDVGKPQYTLVPSGILKAVEKIRRYGNEKYHDPQNWKQVESQRFWDATVRHIVAAWDDYRAIDPEGGLPHIYHAMCNLSFLAERMENGSE